MTTAADAGGSDDEQRMNTEQTGSDELLTAVCLTTSSASTVNI